MTQTLTQEPTPYDEAMKTIHTGDLALFHGSSWISKIIQKLTRNPYSHVGMIVRYEDILGDWTGGEELEFWEDGKQWTQEQIHDEVWFFESTLGSESLPCLLDDHEVKKGGAHSGVQLVKLRDAFCYYDCQTTGTFNIRKLYCDDGAGVDFRRLRELMNTTNKTPFPALVKLLANWMMGLLGLPAQLNTYFCAELVAKSYSRMGLLDIDCRENPPNKYSPKRFSSAVPLDLRMSAFLQKEIVVKVDPSECPDDSAGYKPRIGLARVMARFRASKAAK